MRFLLILTLALFASCDHCTQCSYDLYTKKGTKYKKVGTYNYPEQCGNKKEVTNFKLKVDTCRRDTNKYKNVICVDK